MENPQPSAHLLLSTLQSGLLEGVYKIKKLPIVVEKRDSKMHLQDLVDTLLEPFLKMRLLDRKLKEFEYKMDP